MGRIFTVGIGAIMAVFSIIVVVDFVAAVDTSGWPTILKTVALKSNLHRITCRIRWNLKALLAYGNTELNYIFNRMYKCVETRGYVSLNKDNGIVRTLWKHKNHLSGHNRRYIHAYDSWYRWVNYHTERTWRDGQGRLILMFS